MFFRGFQLLCIIVENESDIAAFKDYVDTGAAEPPKPKAEAKPAAAPPPPPKPAAAAPPSPAPAAAPRAPAAPTGMAGRIFASPLARKLAAERGIDISSLSGVGSGPGGRIRAQDLDKAPPAGALPGGIYLDQDLSGMRKTIAKRLLESKQTIPHYYLTMELEVDELLR